HRPVRRRAVDGRDRVLPARAGDHPCARARLNAETSDWARVEGQSISGILSFGNFGGAAFAADRRRSVRGRCAALADSGPAHRKTSCLATELSLYKKTLR